MMGMTITRGVLWVAYFILMTGIVCAQPTNLLAEVVVTKVNDYVPPVRKKSKRKQRLEQRKKRRLKRRDYQPKPLHCTQMQDEKWNRDYMHGIGFLGLLFSIPAVTFGVILIIGLFRIGIPYFIFINGALLGILGGVLAVIGVLALYFLMSAFIRMKKTFPTKKKVDFLFWIGMFSSVLTVLSCFAFPFILVSFVPLTTSILVALVFSAIGVWIASICGIHFSQLKMRERLKTES